MTTATPAAGPQIHVPLYRSATYEALALGFAYPEAEQRERLIVLLEDMLDSEIEVADELRDAVRALLHALHAAPIEELAMLYTRLFDQSALCSPFETEYEADPFAKARQLADISGFFGAWGLAVSSARPTMHDFIGSELEFLSLLTRKEAYTAARQWTRRREQTLDAERSFLRDHLGRWQRTLCRDLNQALDEFAPSPAADFFRLLGTLLDQFVEDEVRTFRLRPLRLKQRMVGDREPMVCPMAPDVPAVEAGSLAAGDADPEPDIDED